MRKLVGICPNYVLSEESYNKDRCDYADWNWKVASHMDRDDLPYFYDLCSLNNAATKKPKCRDNIPRLFGLIVWTNTVLF